MGENEKRKREIVDREMDGCENRVEGETESEGQRVSGEEWGVGTKVRDKVRRIEEREQGS